MVRTLSCLTSSVLALQGLMRLAGKAWSGALNDWTVHRSHCLITDTQSLRSLSGKLSMISATANLTLHIGNSRRNDSEGHLQWSKVPNAEEDDEIFDDLWTASSLNCSSDSPSPNVDLHHSSLLEEVLPGRCLPPSLAHIFSTWPSNFGLHGGILLKKPPSWPASCPTFCFMVFDNTSFADVMGLGNKILQTYRAGDLYVVRQKGGGGSGRSGSNGAAIEAWTDILLGREVSDVRWPPHN